MTEQNLNIDPNASVNSAVTPVTPVAPVTPVKPPDDGMVKIAPEVYNALLDRLDELEAKNIQGRKPGNVDDLANVGVQRPPADGRPLTEDDLNEMKPAQIVNLVAQHITETQIKPLLMKIEEITVKQEIKEILGEKDADGKPKNADFNDLKEEIYQIASTNPTLSLRQAYELAKTQKAQNASPTQKTGDQLRHLPPRPVISGEKPTTATVATEDKTPETRTDAARQALAEMKKAGRFKI